MEDERICILCNCIVTDDEETEVDGETVCDDCAGEHTTTCDHCGETIWVNDSISDGRLTLCSCYYDEHYRRCESCGRLLDEDDVAWYNDLPYCECCYDSLENEIEEYGYKPDPIFYGEGNRFFGVELELDIGGKYEENARRIKDETNYRCEHIYCKSDGSLDDGFEIVTHPMTLDYHINNMHWADVLHEAVRLGYRSHQTTTCGLHVHVNRDAFGETMQEQESVIEKILFFTETHWNELVIFSRRGSYNLNRWAARYGMEKTGKEILDKAKKGSNGRYAAVNLCPYATIEFRIFRGTLRLNTLIATLQLVNRICDLAMNLTDDEIRDLSWSEFVRGIEEPELIQYLKERQLYVNAEVDVEEEM